MRSTSISRVTTLVAVLALLFACVAVPPALAQTPTYALDCDDEVGNDDTQTNPAGEAERYRCTVTSTQPVSDLEIAAEIISGPNDPDAGATGTADRDPFCTTGVQGFCENTIAAIDNESGTATICFWVNDDEDATFDLAGAANDGGGCDEEAFAAEGDGNQTDVVQKIWQAAPLAPTDLDCDDESGDDAQTNAVGESETYTCLTTAPDSNDAGTAPDPVQGVRIDWENLNGANDPDNSSASGTPDGNDACTTNASGICTIAIASSEGAPGSANVCFWADTDNDNVFDPNGATNDGGGCNQETPATEDDDLIDVVTKTWTGVTPTGLDCDDQSGDDAETNAAGQSETYTCTLTAPDSNDAGTERDPVTGVRIDWENLNGANDPDNSSNNATPDGNDACTTAGTAGSCTITIAPSENQSGTALICFWADTDADNVFAQNGDANDGGGCNQESAATEDTDLIDVVEKTWSAPSAASVDVEPETDTNPTGTNHVITATVYDQFGSPLVGNTTVNFEFFNGSPNDASTPSGPDRTCVTSNSSTCSITITSTTVGTDLVCVWVGATPALTGNNTNGQCAGEGLTDTDDDVGVADAPAPATDRIDVVQKTWQASAASVQLTPEESTSDTGTQRTLTVTVRDASGNPVAGAAVTWTITGQGTIVSQETTTDASGQADAVVTSTTPGNSIVTATTSQCVTPGACSDTATVHWGPARCDIFGTVGNDVLTGTSEGEVICGFGGDDQLIGRGGNDVLRGGGGNDLLRGGGGSDVLLGHAGNDALYGGGQTDLLRGGSGHDGLRGGPGGDRLYGGRGRDLLVGGRGFDLLVGGGGNDTCVRRPGRDRVRRC